MKILLLKAGRVLSRKVTGATLALLCTAGVTVVAIAVTSPMSVAYAQGTSPAANKTPTPKPKPSATRTPTPKPTPKPSGTPKRTPTPKPTPRRTPTPKPKKCEVCHNPRNPHTIKIPCDQVDKFLKNHPGDYRGPCHVTSFQNP
jgi:outer membrane biosynthesis protein TonB